MSIKDLFRIEDSQLVKVGHWDTETLVMGLETVDLWDSQLVKVGHWDTETLRLISNTRSVGKGPILAVLQC